MKDEKRTFFGLDVNSKATPYILLGLVFVLWGGCWVVVPLMYCPPEGSGTFGDMFGAVNALFSGLAFVGLIYTILLQREDLKLTQDELRGQKEEFRTQNITLKRQRFESMFFNMLAIHSNIVKDLRYDRVVFGTKKFHTGIDALVGIVDDYGRELVGYHDSLPEHRKAHEEVFGKSYNIISPYLQSLIALHESIISAKFKKKAKERYCRILASYISSAERNALYYYLASATDGTITRALLKMEKDLDILKTIPPVNLFNIKHDFLNIKFMRDN
jgi:hypothetical protein